MEAEANCPYCGEPVSLWLDDGGASSQQYVEDCSVCCRPWQVYVSIDEHGVPSLQLARLDD
jgi:hypothetical protein